MIRINLLPFREARRRAELRDQLGLMALAVVVAFGLSVALQVWSAARIASARNEVTRIDKKIAEYEPQMDQLRAFEAKRSEVERKLGVIRGLERSRTGPVRALDEIATNTPDRLWLTKLAAKGSTMDIAGFSLDNEVVAEFLTALDGSEQFGGVDLQGTEFVQRDGVRLNEFTVQARLTAKSIEEIQAEAEAAAKKAAESQEGGKGGKRKKKAAKKAEGEVL
jgi:type IV pilus assembly protein PilN